MGNEKKLSVFLINLKEKQKRLNSFQKSSIDFTRIDAVDTRNEDFDLTPYGLKLEPCNKISKLYFSRGRGALGCYLSHYIFWQHIVKEKLQYAVVLEDDAWIPDVEKLLLDCNSVSKHFKNVTEPKLVQFNKRESQNKLPFWMEGTESYAINYEAAKLLINYTNDFSEFENIFIEYMWDWSPLGITSEEFYSKFKTHDDSEKNFSKKHTIRYAVDKFLGYCSHEQLDSTKRLNITFDPRIGLLEENYEGYADRTEGSVSDVMGNGKKIWEMSVEDIIDAEKDKNYMWWVSKSKGKCEDWCSDHPSNLYNKCTWDTFACAACDECENIHFLKNSLWRIKQFDQEPDETSINLIVVLRNEELLIEYFIQHYLDLGVTHFTFIDNSSTDETLSIILDSKNINCQIFYTQDSYSENNYGMDWVNSILNTQLKNKWCLVVDADELVLFDNKICDTFTDLKKDMERCDANVTSFCLIDFYPLNFNPYPDYKPKKSFLSHSKYYDKYREEDYILYDGADGTKAIKGGVRHRVHGTPVGTERVTLSKKSFFKNEMYNTHTLSVGMHWWLPYDFTNWENYKNWNQTKNVLKFYDSLMIIGHFKYLKPNIYQVFEERVKLNQDWNDSFEYKQYIKDNINSFYENEISLKYETIGEIYENIIYRFLDK